MPSIASTTPRRRCRRSTSRVTSGVTFGLPSRSPPTQVPKRSGRSVGSRILTGQGESHGERLQQPADHRDQVVEQVEDRRRLVVDRGTVPPQLVGLPEQVDRLADVPVDAGEVVVGGPRVGAVDEQVGDLVRRL